MVFTLTPAAFPAASFVGVLNSAASILCFLASINLSPLFYRTNAVKCSHTACVYVVLLVKLHQRFADTRMPQGSQRFPPQLWVWLSSEPEFTDDRVALRIC